MTTRTRQMFVAVAFAATAAATITGFTLRGETKEAATPAEICAKADWPLIPAECLAGETHQKVRYIAPNGDVASKVASAETMNLRFAVAFE
jgi:hypothetical protein